MSSCLQPEGLIRQEISAQLNIPRGPSEQFWIIEDWKPVKLHDANTNDVSSVEKNRGVKCVTQRESYILHTHLNIIKNNIATCCTQQTRDNVLRMSQSRRNSI